MKMRTRTLSKLINSEGIICTMVEAYGLVNEKKYPWMPAAWNRNH